MVCPFCNKEDTAVVDSRKNVEGDAIRRRRECSACNTGSQHMKNQKLSS